MAELVTITEGWTQQLGPFTLRNNGEPYNLDGMTVRLFLRSKNKVRWIHASGKVTVDPDQVTNKGQVYFKPEVDDFRSDQSPYAVKWEVVDQAGDVVFFPNGAPDTIVVTQA